MHGHRNRVGLSSTCNQSRSTASSHAGVWNTAEIQHRASVPHVSSYRPSYNSTAGPTAFYTGPVHYSSQPHPLGIATGLIARETEGVGFVTKGYRRNDGKKKWVTRDDKSHLNCEECGMSRHTKEQCFRIVGYPDWWTDGNKKGTKSAKTEKEKVPTTNTSSINKENTSDGRRSDGGFGGLATAENKGIGGDFSVAGKGGKGFVKNSNTPHSQNSLFPCINNAPRYIQSSFKCLECPPSVNGSAHMAQISFKKPIAPWIFDCGATDTMTYDVSDFIEVSIPRKTHIQAANRERMDVKTRGMIEISPGIKLPNCLYVPSLSHKLLSISHVTKELNYSILMHPTFCLLQDIRTGQIIRRGTKREGLYYVDEVTPSGTMMLAHGTSEREAWLWHRRLGHPSVSYLHTLFPELFPLNKPISCETCILAKSYRQTFKPSNTKVKVLFSLIYSDGWGPAPVIGGQSFCGHGEEQCDTLSWLRYTSEESCPNQNTTSPEAQEQSFTNISAIEDTVPNLISERYTPEKTSRSSKYPIANIARVYLSKEANSLSASLYLEEAPSNVEQALKSEKWNNAMDVEMYALMRNGTWDKCILPQGKKPKLKEGLCVEFEMKDLGNLRYFFGIEVMRSSQGIFICQKKYIPDLLAETGMINCKPADTSMITNQKLFMKTKAKLANRDRTKHVEVDRHFIKEKLEAGIIKLPFVKSEDQLADILTKAVGMVILHKCLNKLNFADPTIQQCIKNVHERRLMIFFMGTTAVDVEGVACCTGNVYTCCYESGLPPMAIPPMSMAPMAMPPMSIAPMAMPPMSMAPMAMPPIAMSPMPPPGHIVGEKKKVLGRKGYSIIPSIIHH
uniref:Putative ribonuclease H-like domain-containing protein n=1 Tax=Tanacetum cinerariifolium TaxID=118510 RepID=A0A699HEU6_TANCI|nr:putative ribonuclease H-like domain-containing protein [Tanacetum cinerariifolium]